MTSLTLPKQKNPHDSGCGRSSRGWPEANRRTKNEAYIKGHEYESLLETIKDSVFDPFLPGTTFFTFQVEDLELFQAILPGGRVDIIWGNTLGVGINVAGVSYGSIIPDESSISVEFTGTHIKICGPSIPWVNLDADKVTKLTFTLNKNWRSDGSIGPGEGRYLDILLLRIS